MLMRAVGPQPDVAIDALTYPAAPGDVYVVCSDGLTKALDDEQIRSAIARSPTLAAATRRSSRPPTRATGATTSRS
jgi:protein phosphatase